MKNRNFNKTAAALVLMASSATVHFSSVNAQELQFEGLQRNITLFTGLLEEALDIGQAKGLFGINLGGIDSTYLYGQGVVLEVRTPLANRRNRMSLVSLSTAMQSLRGQTNPFAAIARPIAPVRAQEVTPLSVYQEKTTAFYQEMMDRIASVDYSLAVNSAIQQASESARSLRSMGSVDEPAYGKLLDDIEQLRSQMASNTAELRQLREDSRVAASQENDVADEATEIEIRDRLEGWRLRVEPLRVRAMAKAAELQARSAVAEQEYAARWQAEVDALEENLYAVMCDYGSTLRELPGDERVSIILTGLGAETEDQRRTDRVHVFSKQDLLQCQSGAIDLATLQQRSAQYNY